jgi:GNAT superfamily N-acetyltransferase
LRYPVIFYFATEPVFAVFSPGLPVSAALFGSFLASRPRAKSQNGAVFRGNVAKTVIAESLCSRRLQMPSMMKLPADQLTVERVSLESIDAAWKIMEEYYEAASVVARDSREDFARLYFGDGAGVWLASLAKKVVGCIALRPLPAIANSGEVKRLYVQPKFRGHGIAAALYRSLELYARSHGYQSLYLDTTDEMIAAQKFYAALGYQPAPRYNDNPQATIFMRKDLAASAP